MSEMYKDIIYLIKHREYGKILNTVLTVFISVAPSASYIFMFNRDLFLTLDFLKLSILCLILNFMFIIFMFLATFTGNGIELISSFKKMNMQDYNNKEKEIALRELRIKWIDKSANDMVINILVFTLMLWANYLFFHIYFFPGKPKDSTLVMLDIVIILIFLKNIKIAIKELHNINKEKKQEIQIDESNKNITYIFYCLVLLSILMSIISIFMKTNIIFNTFNNVVMAASFSIALKEYQRIKI